MSWTLQPGFYQQDLCSLPETGTYDISKIIEEYVLAHHLLSKEQGCVEPKRQCNVEQKPYQLPDAHAYWNYFYD